MIERRPAPALVGVAVAPGVVATVALAVHPLAAGLAALGVAVVAAGGRFGSRRLVTLGSAVAFAGVLQAGVADVPSVLVLVGAAGTVVAWTTAQHAVGLGRQLGESAPATRSTLVHAAGATAATLSAGGLALVVSLGAAGRVGPAAVVALLVGAAALAGGLEH